jgi:hypothetical protein
MRRHHIALDHHINAGEIGRSDEDLAGIIENDNVARAEFALAPRIVGVALAADLKPNQELVAAARDLGRSAAERLCDGFHAGDSGARELIGHRLEPKTGHGLGGEGDLVKQLDVLAVQRDRRAVGVWPKALVVFRDASVTVR